MRIWELNILTMGTCNHQSTNRVGGVFFIFCEVSSIVNETVLAWLPLVLCLGSRPDLSRISFVTIYDHIHWVLRNSCTPTRLCKISGLLLVLCHRWKKHGPRLSIHGLYSKKGKSGAWIQVKQWYHPAIPRNWQKLSCLLVLQSSSVVVSDRWTF